MSAASPEPLDFGKDRLSFQLFLMFLGGRLVEAARISLVLLEKPSHQRDLDTELDGNVGVTALRGEYGRNNAFHGHMADLTFVESLESLRRVCVVKSNGITVWLRLVFSFGVGSLK